MNQYPTRPGRIDQAYRVLCHLCSTEINRVTYQEASIWFTKHLDECHPGWEVEAGLLDYLLRHESDIASDINDFGCLGLIFEKKFNRKPEVNEI